MYMKRKNINDIKYDINIIKLNKLEDNELNKMIYLFKKCEKNDLNF